MTKEEKIKEAYGEYWEQVKNHICQNGFLKITDVKDHNINDEIFNLSIDVIESPRRIRPKSLQGIENNNGWISILSEKDLPNLANFYWVIDKNKQIHQVHYEDITLEYCTHYQPIIKPLPPLY